MQFELTSTLLWLGESHVRILVVLVLVASVFLAVVKGRSKVVLVHAKATVDITSRSPNGKLRKQSLLARIKQSCPSLVGRFVPSPFLANGHFQTLYAGASARVSDKSFSYERELLNLPDGGVVAIDWAKPAVQDHEDYAVKPILILLHGLGGGSYDKYILDVIPLALAAGFRVAALNSRGCGGIAIATPQLYSGSYTQDVRLMIDHIHSKNHPSVPMVGVGFSLGANILMKCVGEDGVHSKLTACVSVANPYDLHVGQTFLHSTWMGKQFYSRIMADGLKAFFKKHQNVFDKNPDYEGHIDPIVSEQVHKTTYLSEFDESITRRMFGFRTVYEYYRCGSSAQFIPAIAIPTLLLSDLNDPIAMKESIPYADILGNPNLVLAVTKRGGHLGWYEGWLPRRWYPKPIIEFATMICKFPSCQYEVYAERAKGSCFEARTLQP
ncbi:Alpha/Beta hydrolase protein [Obelidium mucronatum]|nr:Alpha/Beta hydrolase protein [Obelidium mucronatum]